MVSQALGDKSNAGEAVLGVFSIQFSQPFKIDSLEERIDQAMWFLLWHSSE